VFAAPGNPGIAQIGECFPIAADDLAGLRILCKSLKPDLVVVGPEDPLIAGVADELRSDGCVVFGPGKSGAHLEASKAFSKGLMERSGVPTAWYRTFSVAKDAIRFAKELFESGQGAVVKASGAALGKGVVVCNSVEEAEEAICMMLVDKAFGEAGASVVVEERLKGQEFSLLTIASGKSFTSLPVAQDYKRALDGDRGPNTGGMGTYSPVPWLSNEAVQKAEEEIAGRALRYLSEEKLDYRGVLFSGVMVQEGRPFCLEYNVRFGDPETQSVMMRIGSGLSGLLFAAACGEEVSPLPVLDNAVVSVVIASGGYPGSYEKGKPISLPPNLPENVVIFHAGTQRVQGQLCTSGGRVLCVSATGSDIAQARQTAYAVAEQVSFDGMYFRRDVGAEALTTT
jgi:phosphoribosylamine--glycine ligase